MEIGQSWEQKAKVLAVDKHEYLMTIQGCLNYFVIKNLP